MDDIVSPDTPLKQCRQCKRFFPATSAHFYLDKRRKNGLYGHCKQCHHQYYAKQREPRLEKARQHYSLHKEEKRTYQLQRYARHKEELLWRQRQYYREHKDTHRARSHQYHVLHKEELREKQRQYSAQNREALRERARRYHRENREVLLRRQRQYYAEHREEHSRYRRLHREEINEWQKRYLQSERGNLIKSAIIHKRRAQKKHIGGTLTAQHIQEKLKCQQYRCYYADCGYARFERRHGRYIFHLEHTIPVSRTEAGPRHDSNFVVLACPSCNLKKHNKLPHEWPEGNRLM